MKPILDNSYHFVTFFAYEVLVQIYILFYSDVKRFVIVVLTCNFLDNQNQ